MIFQVGTERLRREEDINCWLQELWFWRIVEEIREGRNALTSGTVNEGLIDTIGSMRKVIGESLRSHEIRQYFCLQRFCLTQRKAGRGRIHRRVGQAPL